MKRIRDWLLSWLQRDCSHPGEMVAADVLEGDGGGARVRWCRRCGAVGRNDNAMMLPNPNLWRG